MVEIACSSIAAVAVIISAIIAKQSADRDKQNKTATERQEARAAQRAKEGRLQLAMIAANTELTVGVAMALKRGHCNGEVEAGLKAVNDTRKEYAAFLEGIGIDHLAK